MEDAAHKTSVPFTFDSKIIEQALRNIQSRQLDTRRQIDPGLFSEVRRIMTAAVETGYQAPDPDSGFLQQLRNNAEVFSAFKAHRMGRDMASQLLDEDGNVKPFERFRKDTEGIVDHHVNRWLRTEYDTAIRRAHRAAEMRQFIAEADVFPNIEWLPSTAVNPREEHMPFYHRIWPVDDPFWERHKPGDEWGCQCGWQSTDEPPTDNSDLDDGIAPPSPGLGGNPAKTGEVFTDDHPYFPEDCAHCAFYKPGVRNRLALAFQDRKKGCNDCPYLRGCIVRLTDDGYKLERKYANGGTLYIHQDLDRKKSDFNAIKTIGSHFAKEGHTVEMTPTVHHLSKEYQEIYSALKGTQYERKCPDLKIDGRFYEYEGFVKPWKKDKVRRMFSHGLKQAPNLIIDNTKGCSDRYIRKMIIARQKINTRMDEVWIYEKGKIRLFYKDGKFYKNNGGT